MKVRVITWKIASSRYLHQVEVVGGWFYIVSGFSCFSASSFIISNKVSSKKDTKVIKGLKLIREECEEWIDDNDFIILCFGGSDNLKIRKKIYGDIGKTVKIKIKIFNNGKIDEICAKVVGKDTEFSKNLIPDRSVLLVGRSLRKRIKDPLPYIIPKSKKRYFGEVPKLCFYTVSEFSYIMFLKKIKEWCE